MMKWRDLVRDRAFILFVCVYLFLGLLAIESKSFAFDKILSSDNLFSSVPYVWYNQPWVLAVFTAVLILLVASFGTVKKKTPGENS